MSNRKDCLAAQRISRLLDENSFVELGSLVTARSTDFNLSQTQTPSDGVITGHGLIDGSLVFVYSQDVSVLNGTIGEMHAKKIASVYDMAMKMGAPVIGFLDCAGIRLQESVDALDGFGQIYAKQAQASGVIPQICAVFGTCGGGLSVVPALCDFAFVEKDGGKVFVNSPNADRRKPRGKMRHFSGQNSRAVKPVSLTVSERRMRSLRRSEASFPFCRRTIRQMSIPENARMI